MKIRLLIIVTAILTVFAEKSLAQKSFYFMPKVGLNVSSLKTPYDSDFKYGLNAGLSIEKAFTDRISLESGAFYSQQGVTFNDDEIGEFTEHLDYINIPILAKYFVHQGFNVFGGYQLGINLKAETNYKKSGNIHDYKEFVKTIDNSLVFGAGYRFNMGLIFSANYNLGLTNIMDSEHPDNDKYENEDKIYNRVFQFCVGWEF